MRRRIERIIIVAFVLYGWFWLAAPAPAVERKLPRKVAAQECSFEFANFRAMNVPVMGDITLMGRDGDQTATTPIPIGSYSAISCVSLADVAAKAERLDGEVRYFATLTAEAYAPTREAVRQMAFGTPTPTPP